MVGKRKKPKSRSSRPNSTRSKKPRSADADTKPKHKHKKALSRRTKSTTLNKHIQKNTKKPQLDKRKLPTTLNNFLPSKVIPSRIVTPELIKNPPFRLSTPRFFEDDQLIPVPRNVSEYTGPSDQKPINPESMNPDNFSELFWDGEVVCRTRGDGLLHQWQLYSERVASQIEARRSSLKDMTEARNKRRRKKREQQQEQQEQESSKKKGGKNDATADATTAKMKKKDPDDNDAATVKERSCTSAVRILAGIPTYMYQDLL